MNKKLKKYAILITIRTILISFLIGLTGALLCEGVLYFISEMKHYEIDLLNRLLIDGGVGLVAFIVAFIFTYKGKKAKAKIIDKELRLREKVATMYELENDDSEMAHIQRADALKTIEGKQKRPFRIRFSPLPILLAVVAFVTCSISHFIPYPTVEEGTGEENNEEIDTPLPDIEEESDIKDNNIQGIIDAIQGNDKVPDEIQKEIVDNLEQLDKDLSEDETNDERDDDIEKTIEELEKEKEEALTYDKIGAALQKFESTKELGEAISSADVDKVKEVLDNLNSSFDEIEDFDERNEARHDVGQDITDALMASTVPSTDSLYKALQALARKLLDFEPHPLEETTGGGSAGGDAIPNGESGPDNLGWSREDQEKLDKEELEGALGEAKDEIEKSLEDQKEIEEAFDQAIEDLKNMMSGEQGEPPMDGGEDMDPPPMGGGAGTGETNYGADEILYDPETNTEVTYGELLSYYYGLINATLTEDEVPEELEKMIYTYFGYLFYTEKPIEGENS